jgi:hypothetical protein
VAICQETRPRSLETCASFMSACSRCLRSPTDCATFRRWTGCSLMP